MAKFNKHVDANDAPPFPYDPSEPLEAHGKTRLLISKTDRGFEVDVPRWPGSPACGRDSTIKAALGDWLINNQEKLGLFIDVDKSAKPAEMARRKRELRKR